MRGGGRGQRSDACGVPASLTPVPTQSRWDRRSSCRACSTGSVIAMMSVTMTRKMSSSHVSITSVGG